jgi:hypothetical protein
MRALVTWSMVVDIEPDEISEFAANIERKAMESMHESWEHIERPLDEEEAEEFQERFQFYGVSYSVQQEVKPPTGEPEAAS